MVHDLAFEPVPNAGLLVFDYICFIIRIIHVKISLVSVVPQFHNINVVR